VALRPLPERPFEYIEVKQAKVHIDYHITYQQRHYSVPHQFCRQTVLIRATEYLVEVYHEDRRIACHARHDRHGYSTQKEHMPPNHRRYLEWSPERFCRWAQQVGPHTAGLVAAVLQSRNQPQQAYRAYLGIFKLTDKYTAASLESASKLALEAGAHSYRAVKNLLATKKDMLETGLQDQPVSHEHVRGESYYT
jgi:hypothetical protein